MSDAIIIKFITTTIFNTCDVLCCYYMCFCKQNIVPLYKCNICRQQPTCICVTKTKNNIHVHIPESDYFWRLLEPRQQSSLRGQAGTHSAPAHTSSPCRYDCYMCINYNMTCLYKQLFNGMKSRICLMYVCLDFDLVNYIQK